MYCTLLWQQDKAIVTYAAAFWLGIDVCLARKHISQCLWRRAGVVAIVAWILFYRDEDRAVTNEHADDIVFSACDGTVVACSNTEVIAFLSPIDMHTQKVPMSGTVVSITHKPGEFNPAFLLEKTEFNERTTTVFATKHGNIAVVQVAGQLARRIVTMVKTGDKVDVGQTYGLIRLGSQVRLRVPLGFKCLTRIGAKINAAETPLFYKA